MKVCCKCGSNVEEKDCRTLRRCKHVHCCECLVSMVQNLAVPKVKCSIRNCAEIIPDKVMREILSNDQLKCYDQISVNSSSKNVFKCLTPNCPYLILYEIKDTIFGCPYCNCPNCIKCKKRHFPTQCGQQELHEEYFNAIANDHLKKRNREEFEQLKRDYTLLPNPQSFECQICFNFILPRVGVILRNCNDLFCKPCLKYSFQEIKYIGKLTCPREKCSKILDTIEINHFINEEKLAKMMLKEASSRLYSCKNGECPGVWDVKKLQGSHECPVCHEINCHECQDIHSESCELFRMTKRYTSVVTQNEALNKAENIKCFHCLKLLIRKGGCGALNCDLCGNHTCIYTGKIAGVHKAEKCYCNGEGNCTKIMSYCGCTSNKPCVERCKHGCIPEDEDN